MTGMTPASIPATPPASASAEKWLPSSPLPRGCLPCPASCRAPCDHPRKQLFAPCLKICSQDTQRQECSVTLPRDFLQGHRCTPSHHDTLWAEQQAKEDSSTSPTTCQSGTVSIWLLSSEEKGGHSSQDGQSASTCIQRSMALLSPEEKGQRNQHQLYAI